MLPKPRQWTSAVIIAMANTIGIFGLTGFTVDEALSTTRLSETLAA